MSRRAACLVLLLAVGVSPALTAGTAHAAPRVTVKVAVSTVQAGLPISLTGRVKGSPLGAKVVLQHKVAGRWSVVDQARLAQDRKYTLGATAHEGVNRLRVKVNRTGKRPRAISEVVRVSGLPAVVPPTPPTPPSPPASATELARVQGLILARTNEFRIANGLAALQPMPALDQVAQRWTERMAADRDFRHNPDFASQYPTGWTSAGENIAAGYTAESVVAGWIGSPGHRANLLGNYTHLGVGYAEASGTRYYTQNFARYAP